MIDLDEIKKVTAVLKLFLNAWRRQELSFMEIIFTFLQSLIHRTQDKLGIWRPFNCHLTCLTPY